MKFFFNVNNDTQAKILRKAGVRYISLTYKYTHNSFDKLIEEFDDYMINPGNNISRHDDYYSWINSTIPKGKLVLQIDDITSPVNNYKQWIKGKEMYDISPIIHGHYIQSLSIYRPELKKGDYVALGKMEGRLEEDDAVKLLSTDYKYHGLAKGRWIRNSKISSIDSTTWLSGVKGRKTDVFGGQSIMFGDKGKQDIPQVQLACQMNLIYLKKLNLTPKDLISGSYESLLKAPLCLYYMPMFKQMGIYNDNFKS